MYNKQSYSNGSGTSSRGKKERRVSILIKHTDPNLHCAGVESLVATPSGDLFSASRDSTIKRWRSLPGQPQPVHTANFEDHTDWVNDIVLISDRLVSCSNDKTVKIWNAASEGECLYTLQCHSDYVTCLAAAPDVEHVYSAGLRSEIFSYDLQAQRMDRQFLSGKDGGQPPKDHGSIYAIDATPDGHLLAVGTTGSHIRIIDPREKAKVMKLRGHVDNIRALRFLDGNLLLSASSDHTMRLWDLGQQRCLQTYTMHADSVWALSQAGEHSTVYSGGRDGCVYRTSFQSRTSELVYYAGQPVTSLAAVPGRCMWISTTSPTITGWELPPPSLRTTSIGSSRGISGRGSLVGLSAASRLRQSQDPRNSAANPEPLVASPAITLPGAAGIVHHKVLNNRRFILTKDSGGDVVLWDVITGGIEQRYGPVDLDTKAAELSEPVAVSPWFTCDHRLGALQLHLEPPTCFSAELYALELGQSAQEDMKYNYGQLVLKNVLEAWILGKQQYAAGGDHTTIGPLSWSAFQTAQISVISSTEKGSQWRKLASSFTGEEAEGTFIPQWVVDAVLHSQLPPIRELKCAFILLPLEGSGLPSLIQSRLNAPRILQVSKVAHYCQSKLVEQRIEVGLYERSWNAHKDAQIPQPAPGTPVLELTCQGYAVPYDMSIASVKAHIWKRSDDVVFNFTIRNPAKPAPLPNLLAAMS